MTDALATQLGTILTVVAALLAFVALFGNGLRLRLRGGRQCPRCGYDVSHRNTTTCSECGFVAKRPRAFTRGRRWWRWVVVAFVLACGAHVVRCVPGIRERGWIAAVPSSVLVFTAPVGAEAWETRDRWLGETHTRLATRQLTEAQSQRFIDRIVAAHPQIWSELISTRAVWPEDEPIGVVVSMPWLLTLPGARTEIRLRPAGRDAAWRSLRAPNRPGESARPTSRTDGAVYGPDGRVRSSIALTTAAPGPLRFDVELWRQPSGGPPRDQPTSPVRIWRGVSPPIERAARGTTVVAPLPDDAVPAGFPDVPLAPRLHIDGDQAGIALGLRIPDAPWYGAGAPWSFAVSARVWGDGELLATGHVLHRDQLPAGPPTRGNGREVCYRLQWMRSPWQMELFLVKEWRIELTGCPRTALAGLDAQYWDGTWVGDGDDIHWRSVDVDNAFETEGPVTHER